jgi:hypothetical protein
VWQAIPYLQRRDDYANIPPLENGDNEVTNNPEKAQLLMEIFFPSTEQPPPEIIVPIPWEPHHGNGDHKGTQISQETNGTSCG